MKGRRSWTKLIHLGVLIAGVACASLCLATTLAEEDGAAAAEPALRPVHPDPEALEQAVVDAVIAFLREDAPAARAALDRVESGSRPLHRDDDAAYGRDVLSYDVAFHRALGVVREFAGKGDLGKSFDQFVFVQRACIVCHGLAREEGLLPDVRNPKRSSD